MASILGNGISGININALIDGLIKEEAKLPTQRLDFQESKAQATISAMGLLKNSISEFKTAISALNSLSSFRPRSVISSDTDVFTASATSKAGTGTYSIQVNSLAKGDRLQGKHGLADVDAIVGTGSLTIGVGEESFTINVTEDNRSLGAIKDAINNAADNKGVEASLITVDKADETGKETRLVLTGTKMGEDNMISISVNDDDGNNTDGAGLSIFAYDPDGVVEDQNMLKVETAASAEIEVDGLSVKSDTNVFQDVINGTTITLQDIDINDLPKNETLTISLDKAKVKDLIKKFTESYSKLNETIRGLTAVDSENETASLLTGDSMIRTIENQMRTILNSQVVNGTSPLQSLSSIGVTTEKDGSMTINDSQFDKVFEANFDDIGELFASDNGYIKQLEELADKYIQSGGFIDSRSDGLDLEVKRIGEERQELASRLENMADRYRAQFGALDALIAQLNQTSSFLAQQFESLPGFSNKSKK